MNVKIILGCDVDPDLPLYLRTRPSANVWDCLRNLDVLVELLGEDLPPVTWLIRADESVRFSTGAYDSGYLERHDFWDRLRARGHELGWHMHLASFKPEAGCFGFDSRPPWLADANSALGRHFPIRSTRTGWDYSDSELFRDFESLGVNVDFSALPGNVAWFRMGPDRFKVDWLRCPETPYHPSRSDYQSEGDLGLLEIPITQFRQSLPGTIRRALWRSANGVSAIRGLRTRTLKLSERWSMMPDSPSAVWAFYFHPGDLNTEGDYQNVLENLRLLRSVDGAEFVTATEAGLFAITTG